MDELAVVVTGSIWHDSLEEIVPQDTGRVLDDPQICRHVGRTILHHGSVTILPATGKELAKLGKSRETPIAFIGSEAMICGLRTRVSMMWTSERTFGLNPRRGRNQ